MERALATCVVPAPPPPPPPPPTAVVDGDNGSNGAKAALDPGVGAPSRGDGSDGLQGGAAAAAEALSSVRNGTAGVSGGNNDASQGDLTPDTNSSSPPSPAGGDPHAAVDAQGGSADYMDFVRLRGLVSKKAAAACFRSRTFLRFPRDIRARIPSRVFFKHVYESVTLQKTRLTLQ